MGRSIINFSRDGFGHPNLSILIPFYNHTPVSLLESLARQLPLRGGEIEIILIDDGSACPELTAKVIACLGTITCPATLLTLMENEGRAAGRNRLITAARGDYVLFLDCDMLPDADDFVQKWLDLVTQERPDVVFGGFSLAQASRDPGYALHRAMAAQGDTFEAALRRQAPEKYIFTSNLLIRADILSEETFDPEYLGWGWEDVEWGIRISRRWTIRHIDNPASHLGLDSAETLAEKYEQSVANFARVVRAHWALVATYPSYQVARLLKLAPLRRVWRPALKALALAQHAPLEARALAMRLYRAALYAEVV